MISEAEAILNQLKDFKSKIEGSHFTFQPIVLDKQLVTTLKHSVVAFTPKTITEQAKHRIVDQLLGLLEGQVRKVLYACLLTCPWFAAVQDEVSGKAKNNILFVVYVARDEQFFSLATQHEKELCEVCEEVSLASGATTSNNPVQDLRLLAQDFKIFRSLFEISVELWAP